MTAGLSRRGSRPAAVALLTIGAVVLAFALARDVPKTQKEGLVGQSYNDARAGAEVGLYTEIAGGALRAAGVLDLAWTACSRRRRRSQLEAASRSRPRRRGQRREKRACKDAASEVCFRTRVDR